MIEQLCVHRNTIIYKITNQPKFTLLISIRPNKTTVAQSHRTNTTETILPFSLLCLKHDNIPCIAVQCPNRVSIQLIEIAGLSEITLALGIPKLLVIISSWTKTSVSLHELSHCGAWVPYLWWQIVRIEERLHCRLNKPEWIKETYNNEMTISV